SQVIGQSGRRWFFGDWVGRLSGFRRLRRDCRDIVPRMKIAALLLLGGALAAQNDASIAARLQRLEDIEEIRTVLLDYGRFLDSRDLAAYSRLFAADGECVGGFGTAKGPAGILEFMQKNLGTGPNRNNSYHIL